MAATFGFRELVWVEGDKPRKVDSLAGKVKRGRVELLIFLACLVSHKAWDKVAGAAKATKTPFALVGNGYEVEAIRDAIEAVLLREAARA